MSMRAGMFPSRRHAFTKSSHIGRQRPRTAETAQAVSARVFQRLANCDLDQLPMRRTDNARIIDTQTHTISMKLMPGESKLLRRRNGNIERQHRLNLGQLPVAYRSQPSGRFLYILDDAVERRQEAAAQGQAPVPPCIVQLAGGAGIVVDVEDKADAAGIINIKPEVVRVQILTSVANVKCNDELMDFLARALAVRLSALSVVTGWYTRRKTVQFANVSREDLYKKLQKAMTKGYKVELYVPSSEPKNR